MKRTLQLTTLCLVALINFNSVTAQSLVLNSSFEEWITLDNGKEMPVNWITRDALDTAAEHIYCEKMEEAEDGDFSFTIHNKHVGNACYASYVELGEFDPADPNNQDNYGMEMTERPTALAFYYKYKNPSPFQFYKGYAEIRLEYTDPTSNEKVLVGEGRLEFDKDEEEFTYAEVEVEYLNDETPDKMYIRFGNPCDPTDSISLSIDYVGLVGFGTNVSNNNITFLQNLKTTPNPTSDYFRISNFEGEAEVEMFNMIGQVVERYSLNNSEERLSVNELSNGIYLYRLIQEGQIKYTGKLTVQR